MFRRNLREIAFELLIGFGDGCDDGEEDGFEEDFKLELQVKVKRLLMMVPLLGQGLEGVEGYQDKLAKVLEEVLCTEGL